MASGVDYCVLVKTSHEGCCISKLEKLVKDWPGGSYFVINGNTRVPGGRSLLAIGYRYNFSKVLGFIADEGAGSTEPGDTYLSPFPDIYSNVYVWPVVCTHFLVGYFNACNGIDNHNRMWQYDLALENILGNIEWIFYTCKYSGIGYGYYRWESYILSWCCREKCGQEISTLEYNNRTFYD